MLDAFIYGFILALGLIIPLGVQNIFIFNQGASQKHVLHALPSVITAFLCDATLIIIAVLGLSVVVLTIPWLKTVIFIVGICFLTYMGWNIWKTDPAVFCSNTEPCSPRKQIVLAASASLLNPHAILDTIGVIGTNSLEFDGIEKLAFTLACLSVSLLWFFGLSIAGHYLHQFDKSGRWILFLNKISAIIIWIVAVYIAVQLFLHLAH